MTLNADQVIDLVFPDGNFYRGGRTHKCEGNTGISNDELQIDILHDGDSSFQEIPSSNIVINRKFEVSNCRKRERVEFAIRFTEEMVGGRIRCYLPNSMDNGTVVDLQLIPSTLQK